MKQIIINIDRSEIVQKTAGKGLTKTQRLVCKLFKIEPRLDYFYRVNIWAQNAESVQPGNLLIDEEGRRWFAISVGNGVITIGNSTPAYVHSIGGKLAVIGLSFKEGAVRA